MSKSETDLSSASPCLLLVEDDPALREALEVTLAMESIAYLAVDSAEAAQIALEARSFSAMVSDIRLPKASGLALLFEARRRYSSMPVVLMTAYADAKTAVEALRGGARDFLLKPFKPEQFIEVVRRYLPEGSAEQSRNDGPVAVDPLMRQLMTRIERVAQTDATVLLLGDSGSGKEVMAQYLHQRSMRAGASFVAINCAAIPSTLLEATLFGHEKGAFTGALKGQSGKFELAQGGSIFLDEIGEMPMELQSKLLRVLQEKQVERVGSHQTISLDVRVIAATNQDLAKRVAQGQFREDLFYRINVFPLKVPALRERPADIIPLAERFLLKYRASMGQPEARLGEPARQLLRQYPWPGNVRELENAIQRALLLCNGYLIEPADLALDFHNLSQPSFVEANARPEAVASAAPALDASDEAENALNAMRSPGAEREGQDIALKAQDIARNAQDIARNAQDSVRQGQAPTDMRQLERDHILSVLRQVGGNRRKAVEMLGISERTLRYKLKVWREAGIDVP